MLTTTHGHMILQAPVRARTGERAAEKAATKTAATIGHSRWEIAALLGTMFLLLPFGIVVLLGL